MELILVILAIITAAFSKQLADEFKAWTPSVIGWLIRRAASRTHKEHQARYLEEWQGHVNEIPGEIGKYIAAFGFLKASYRISGIATGDAPHETTSFSPRDISLIDLYKAYRKRIEHEDFLIHNRIMWLLIPESLLILLGMLFLQFLSHTDPSVINFLNYRILTLGIGISGLALALFCLRAIVSAEKAITVLRRNWDDAMRIGTVELPCLTGSGSARINLRLSIPVMFPIFFCTFWTAILIVVTFPGLIFWIERHLPAVLH